MTACFRCHTQDYVGTDKPTGACEACHTPGFELKPPSHLLPGFMPKGHGKLGAAEESRTLAASNYSWLNGSSESTTEAEGEPKPRVRREGEGHETLGESLPTVESINECSTCHKKQFCIDCHGGVPMPHPADFKDKHGELGKAAPKSCAKCHGTGGEGCNSCHHGEAISYEYNPATPWRTQHPAAVSQVGAAGCLDECHNPTYCSNCHVNGGVRSQVDAPAILPGASGLLRAPGGTALDCVTVRGKVHGRAVYSLVRGRVIARTARGNGRGVVQGSTASVDRKAIEYVASRSRVIARSERVRLSRALNHVRTCVGHGSLHAHFRDVSPRLQHHGRVHGAPRHQGAHRQPRRVDAQQAGLRRRSVPGEAQPGRLRHRPSLAATCPRLGRSGQGRQEAAPEHAGHLRQACPRPTSTRSSSPTTRSTTSFAATPPKSP